MSAPTQSGELLADALRKDGRRVRFRGGQALFTEGDLAERVFVIERGWVIISSVAPGGREIVLGVRGPGDVIGDLSALDGAPRSATALAVGQVEATVAPGSTLTRALTDPGTAMELLRILAAGLRDADRKRLEFAALDTLGRVAWRLQELADRFGESTSVGIEVELPLSQEQLASWCGASREATVKALATLRTLGSITTGRRSVLIRDTESLRRHRHGAMQRRRPFGALRKKTQNYRVKRRGRDHAAAQEYSALGQRPAEPEQPRPIVAAAIGGEPHVSEPSPRPDLHRSAGQRRAPNSRPQPRRYPGHRRPPPAPHPLGSQDRRHRHVRRGPP